MVYRFESEEVKEAFYTSPKHDEIRDKVFGEGLIEGEVEARWCRKAAGTRV